MAKKATARPVDKAPIIVVPPKDRYDYNIVRKQVPADVYNNLAGALTGNIENQSRMFWAMLDSWPRLQSNINDMQEAVAGNRVVLPYVDASEYRPTDTAIAKSEFVKECIKKMDGDMGRNELNFDGLVRNIVYGYYASPYVAELYWSEGMGEIYPHAAKSVPPNYFGYPPSEKDDYASDHLVLFPNGLSHSDWIRFPQYKFITTSRLSYPGHPSLASPMRAMTTYWMAANYGIEWLMQYAQLFGVPFRWAEVANSNDMNAVNNMLASMGSSGHGAFPPNTKINFEGNPSSGSVLPQSVLRDLADKQCDIWVRGETLTSDEGSSGSRSLGEVHERVYLKRKQAVARFVTRVITEQYVKNLIELNFGNTDELPVVAFEIPDPAGKVGEVDRLTKILKMGIPMTNERVYDIIGEDQPEEGAEMFEAEVPDTPGVPGAPPGGDVTDTEDRPAEKTEDYQAAAMRRVKAAQDSDNLQALVDNTLRGLTGLQPQWLGGVRPFFERLIAKAQDATVSEEDFAAALAQASKQLPDQFDRLDTAALAAALDAAKMSAVTLGAEEKLQQFDRG